MSLHDIDKTHGRRLNPSPNSNDKVADRLAAGTTQNHNAGEEALSDGLKMKERQIIAVQDGFNKAIFGFYGDANKFGFKVAQDGFDVLTATDDQLIFNSEQNMFKIAKVVTGTYSLTGTDITNGYFMFDIDHDLGYIPTVVGSFTNSLNGLSYPLPIVFTTNIDYFGLPPSAVMSIVNVDTTKVSIHAGLMDIAGVTLFAAGVLITVKIYCMQETQATP